MVLTIEISKVWRARQKVMKRLNDYMAMSYRMEVVEDKDEGGIVSYLDLPGCITCGDK